MIFHKLLDFPWFSMIFHKLLDFPLFSINSWILYDFSIISDKLLDFPWFFHGFPQSLEFSIIFHKLLDISHGCSKAFPSFFGPTATSRQVNNRARRGGTSAMETAEVLKIPEVWLAESLSDLDLFLWRWFKIIFFHDIRYCFEKWCFFHDISKTPKVTNNSNNGRWIRLSGS